MSGTIGDNVYRASGVVAAAAAGGGAVSWQTGSIKTAGFTPTAGEGYFINTTAGAITITLAAGVVGEMVGVKDYAQTWQTNNLTITPNGTDNIGGINADSILSTKGQAAVLIYVDSTRGWVDVSDSTSTIAGNPDYMTASVSGSCNTLSIVCTDYKVAKFVNPGCFTVCVTGVQPQGAVVDYLVVAGGGSGGRTCGGGGGAGGYRESGGTTTGCYTVSPLGSAPSAVAAQPVSAQAYPIAVGAGGAAISPPATGTNDGVNSSFACITSAGGGGGGCPTTACKPGRDGGSGGGAARDNGTPDSGQGNTPPTSPAQGFNGGATTGAGWFAASGGGGALALGGNSTGGSAPAQTGGPGGTGATSSIDTTPTARAGGGGGCIHCASGTQGTGGPGGGGNGSFGTTPGDADGQNATVLLGGGGGGSHSGVPGSGGSGIVYIRYKFQ